jgi:hypothetical protein
MLFVIIFESFLFFSIHGMTKPILICLDIFLDISNTKCQQVKKMIGKFSLTLDINSARIYKYKGCSVGSRTTFIFGIYIIVHDNRSCVTWVMKYL